MIDLDNRIEIRYGKHPFAFAPREQVLFAFLWVLKDAIGVNPGRKFR